MNWANPGYLFLLLIPLGCLIFFRRIHGVNRRDLELFAAKGLLPKIMDDSGIKIRIRQWIFLTLALILLILALAGPEWGYQWQAVKQQGLEIMVALDTSKSMLAADLKPNRLERAKLAVKELLNKLQGDRVGLIAFAGTSFLQCPLTFDYNAFGIALDALNTDIIPRGGTAVGAAIDTARQAFRAGSSGSKILIIITDGENHEGDPAATATAAAKEGIVIYTVGLGNPSGELVLVPGQNGASDYLKDANGNVVKTSLNESLLRKVAAAAGGSYIRGNGFALGIDQLYERRLSKLAKGEISSKWRKRYLNRYQIPLAVALLLFGWSFWLGIPAAGGSHGRFGARLNARQLAHAGSAETPPAANLPHGEAAPQRGGPL